MSARSASGRIHVPLLVLAVLAVAAIVVLMFGNPFAGDGGVVDRDEGDYAAGDLTRGAAGGAGDQPGDGEEDSVGLVGQYGEGDLGAVRVRLLNVSGGVPYDGQPVNLVARTGGETGLTTGPDGIALFGSVFPGRGYRLEIAGEGHAPVTIQGIRVNRAETTDLGDIMLGEHVVLRGRVIDGTGRAVPGTSVAVYTNERRTLTDGFFTNMVSQATTFPAPLESVLTDDGGWFALKSLSDGSYRLEARHSGFATSYETDVVVAQDRPARTMKIVLGEGATATGHVRSETGEPVTGARVVAIKDSGNRFFASATLERDVALTDASGRYVLDTLTQGTGYRFGVIAEGYAPIFEMTAEQIEGAHHEKDFELVMGGAIAGTVRRVDDGEPIAGATVLAAVGQMNFGGRRRGGGTDGAKNRTATAQTKTDDEGRFVLKNVFPGPIFTAQVKAFGYVPFTASMFTGNQWGAVVPGETLNVEVELQKGGAVEGKIVDLDTREPIPGADVTVIPGGRRGWMVFMTGAPSTKTDGEGHYQLVGVPPGDYGVVAFSPGYAASDAQDEAVAVTVPEAGGTVSRDVSLKRAGSVTGVVTDSTGEPIAGARVRSRIAREPGGQGGRRGGRGNRMRSFLPGGSGVDLTDQDGRFVIEDVSSDARWILSAEAEEFVLTESEPFQVKAGERKKVDLAMVGGGTLEGRVVDDRGGFVAGARVRVGHIPTDRAGQGRLNAWQVDRYLKPDVFVSDTEGRFRAENLTPGIGVVKVELDGYVTYYKRNVLIRADETFSNYTVALVKGDVMEGRVKGSNGQPVEGAIVGVTKGSLPGEEQEEEPTEEESEEIEPRLSGRSDADGKFVIENVPPGMYKVVVWFAPGYQTWARTRNEAAVKSGIASSATTVEFRLEAEAPGQSPFPGGGR